MQKIEILNIYLEQIILNEDRNFVWNKFISSKENQSLYAEENTQIK